MVFIQVILGGITRLTDSGLSITEWELIKGVIPPLTEADWQIAFDKYQNHAKQQYEALHADMTMSSFKWIYFWEWIHRMWARMMGFVFLIPLTFFAAKKWIDRPLAIQLVTMFSLAALEGLFGWIMVASGLNNDQRTWVSAYKLMIHLGIASALFGYIYWTICSLNRNSREIIMDNRCYKWACWIAVLFFIQILLGGLMAGMRAALLYPYYPAILHLDLFKSGLGGHVGLSEVINYERSIVMKTYIQLIHRGLALVLLILSIYIHRKVRHHVQIRRYFIWVMGGILTQYLLGILTIVYSRGGVPVNLGVIHQAVALLVFLLVLRFLYNMKYRAAKIG
ncbi:UNVERIFIED_CONTAM: hypothetical protein GTU68_047889 [Idotea baltica]|nr:hypothetical protein [Idotea baltica]